MNRNELSKRIEFELAKMYSDSTVEVVIEGDDLTASFSNHGAANHLFNYLKKTTDLFPEGSIDQWNKNGRYYVSHKLNHIHKNLLSE